MTYKDSHQCVIKYVLPVSSAHTEQLNQYRVKPVNIASAAITIVTYVTLAFIALLQKEKSFVQRAHIVKEMLQPVKDAKLDILVKKVVELFVQKALTKITLIKLVVSHVLVDTIARVQVRRIHTRIHAIQDKEAKIVQQNVILAILDSYVLMQV